MPTRIGNVYDPPARRTRIPISLKRRRPIDLDVVRAEAEQWAREAGIPLDFDQRLAELLDSGDLDVNTAFETLMAVLRVDTG